MTPRIEDKTVQHLLRKLNATHTPLYLKVEPEPNAQIKDCFIAVREKVEKQGGRMILGWQVWKTEHLVEAECHAVWEDEEENLHDITPKEINVSEILFVEDENIVYEDKQIDNVRMNITDNDLVDDLILVNEAIFKFDNKGERALLYDLSRVLTEEQIRYKAGLMKLKEIISVILVSGGRRKSQCPCQSGKRYRDCHGHDLKKRLEKDV
ncbi:MAG: zinc chelation protein SecC [Chitinophagaceae bacterium]|nr:MAG: zinc chelation protein SecC [Chitinophagaceae bacterium]